MIDKEVLGHQLEFMHKLDEFRNFKTAWYFCKECGLEIYKGSHGYMQWNKNNTAPLEILDITCDEVKIKKILE